MEREKRLPGRPGATIKSSQASRAHRLEHEEPLGAVLQAENSFEVALFEAFLHGAEEARSVGSVNDAVVV